MTIEMVPATPIGPQPTPSRRRSQRVPGALGIALTVALSFAWGALAYRELAPATAASETMPEGLAAVAGAEAAPAWIDGFATAFCDGDADALAARLGPPLSGNVDGIKQALRDRDWDCSAIHYLGGGTNTKGSFYVYVMSEGNGSQQWWVFTASGDEVIAIE